MFIPDSDKTGHFVNDFRTTAGKQRRAAGAGEMRGKSLPVARVAEINFSGIGIQSLQFNTVQTLLQAFAHISICEADTLHRDTVSTSTT